MKFTYCDINNRQASQDIGLLFPGFGADEVLTVMSPHDDDAITAYVSQEQIIKNLVLSRRERRTPSGSYVEPYIAFDCRPKISFKPYIDWVEATIKEES